MKKLIIITSVLFAILAGTVNAESMYNRDIDVNYFYGALQPYGEWIEVGYDDYVWRPYKSDYDWRPYGEGRWEWTRNGWYWDSYEPFGWATYHYGRWYFDDHYGWVWMPDDVWAPAWVEWRYNDNYIGWAPLPPYAKFNHRHGIHFSINWNSGYVHWNFVRYNHFTSYSMHKHFVHNHYVKDVFHKTKYRTNYFDDNNRIVNGGVSRKFVERKIGKKFTTRTILRTNNYSDYNSKDRRSRNDIVDYRPSNRNTNSSFDKTKVTKGRNLSSLRKDKVEISKRTVTKEIYKTNDGKSKDRSISIDKKNNTTERKVVRKEAVKRNTNNTNVNKTRETTVRSSSIDKSPVNKSVNKREVIKRTEQRKEVKSTPTVKREVKKRESSSSEKSKSERTRS